MNNEKRLSSLKLVSRVDTWTWQRQCPFKISNLGTQLAVLSTESREVQEADDELLLLRHPRL